MQDWPARLGERIAALPAGQLWLGFSAGLDSSVLLHALAALPQARARGLTALHIHHGLQPQADAWAMQAAQAAAALAVPLRLVRVQVDRASGQGLEAAARAARRAAFLRELPQPVILALAQHRDDQAETLLLRLLHGAGNEGLAGIRPLRRLQHDDPARLLWRPLLDLPRSALLDYARQHALHWVQDPSNADPRHARSRLRHQVLPQLEAAFPGASAALAAAAQRLEQESDALEHQARNLLPGLIRAEDNALDAAALGNLPQALSRRILGLWLDQRGLPRPPAGIWARLYPELLQAGSDTQPLLTWRGARLRRYRTALHADNGQPTPALEPRRWDGLTPLPLPGGLGRLHFDPPLLHPQHFLVRPRQGGETLQLRGHRHALKKLLQDAAVPPWQRPLLPLLFDARGQLCSVAGRWHSDAFSTWLAAHHTRLHLQSD